MNEAENLLKSAFDFVIWILVPLILLFVLGFTKSLAKKKGDVKSAGFWAGFMLFVVVLIYQVSVFLEVGFPHNKIFQGFSLGLALAGAVIGFSVLAGVKNVTSSKLSGWIAMIVTFITFYALLHYLFIRTYNEILLSLILGTTVGILAHFASPAHSSRDLL